MIKQYERYNQTGVQWLGNIPEHWEVKRIKDILKNPLKYGANEPAIDDDKNNPRYIRITDFGENEILREDTFKSVKYEIAKNYLLQNGDLLFARSGATVGKSFQFKNYNGLACYAGYLIKATPNTKIIQSDFLSYYTKSISYDEWKKNIFIQATIQNISAEKYDRLELMIPTLEEQTTIAQYLDAKTQAIDKKINLLTKKAETYKELRKSIINSIVSGKWLIVNGKAVPCEKVSMIEGKLTIDNSQLIIKKESGIDWIGKIPEHWEVKRFKAFAKTIKGRNLEFFEQPFEKSLPNLSLDYLRNDKVEFVTYCYTADKSQLVDENDLIIIWDGAGVGEILKGKKGFISSTTAKLDFDKTMYSKFFFHLKDSLEYTLKQIPTGMGIPHLNPQVLNNFPCPFPPKSEQTAIANYLDEKRKRLMP